MLPSENLQQSSFTGSVGTEEEASGSGRDVEVEIEEEWWLLLLDVVVGELHSLNSDSAGGIFFILFLFFFYCHWNCVNGNEDD